MSAEAHAHPNYVKVWAILVALLAVSVIGPEVGDATGIQAITLFTAFGIAIVKAYMVCKNFMHLNVEKRYIVYLLTTCLVFMLLFFAAAAPDVMKTEGTNWTKPLVLTAPPAHHGEDAGHGDSHGGADAGAH